MVGRPTWTYEEDNVIRDHWGVISASEIAKRIGRPSSKNAVLGRADRIGLKRLGPHIIHNGLYLAKSTGPVQLELPWPIKQEAGKKKPTKKKPAKKKPAKKEIVKKELVKKQRLSPIEAFANAQQFEGMCVSLPPLRSPRLCCWPIGEPKKDLVWCDEEAAYGRPYCPKHCRVAYIPLPRRQSWAESGA